MWDGGIGGYYNKYYNDIYVWPVRAETTSPAQIWKTGQTTNYASGDDGDLERGVAWPNPRYIDHENGTVTDSLTGLIWTKDADTPGPSECNPGIEKTWQGALEHIKCLNNNNYLGYNNWRLPNRKELYSLLDYSNSEPALQTGHPFTYVQSYLHWSSTTYAYYTRRAWAVGISIGNFGAAEKFYSSHSYIWPVRGGQVGPQSLTPNTVLTDQVFDDKRLNTYKLSLSKTSTIAILSAGPLDLKGVIKDGNGNEILSNSGYIDSGWCICFGGPRQRERGHAQTNFMLRSENLSPGTYTVEVKPESETTPIQDKFAIVFLKRPTNSEEFYAGLDALLADYDDTNDYFDIYVKALYPEYYDDVIDITANANYGSTWCDSGVCRERQCKALSNFYLEHILKEPVLYQDASIRATWLLFTDTNNDCIADDDFILKGDGDLIYHGNSNFGSRKCGRGRYCYNPVTNEILRGVTCNADNYVQRGDIFVQRFLSINHYGLVYDSTNVIDANVKSDGLLRKGDNDSDNRKTANWKVARPR